MESESWPRPSCPFDGGRWRLEAGALRAGPGGAAGVGLTYAPSKSLSFDLDLTAPGLGREFRLASSNGVVDGVGRDSAGNTLDERDVKPSPELGGRSRWRSRVTSSPSSRCHFTTTLPRMVVWISQ